MSRTALAAAIALGVVAVPAAAITAPALLPSGEVQAAVAAAATAEDDLVLSTTSGQGIVTWGDSLRQEFSGGQQCLISNAADSDALLEITGSVGGGQVAVAGFRDGDIGVFEPGASGTDPNNASQCSRVDAGSFTDTESLTLQLGTDLVDQFGALAAAGASVDIEARSKTLEIEATLLDSDGDDVHTLGWNPWRGLKPGSTVNTPEVALASGFSGIRLTAVQGSFSLRGATFALTSGADGILSCGASTPPIAVDGANPGIELTRLENADPNEGCVPILYTLRNNDAMARFLKSMETQVSAQFILDFTWIVTPANTDWESTGPFLPPTETTIDYEQGAEPIELRWCPDVTTDVDGPTGISNVLSEADDSPVVDQEPLLEGKQFTCILSQNARVVDGGPDADDYVTVEQSVYLLGDAAYRFR